MNEVIKTLNNHRSIRSYTEEPVTQEMLKQIVGAAQSAPSSINGQQVTIISVEDRERKSKLSELAGSQRWIEEAPVFLVFCTDFNRARIAAELNGEKLVITESMESVLVGAVDAGLAMSFAIAAAESLGLGIVPIGAVRMNPEEVIKLLNLPRHVYPICGLVVGHPKDMSAKKPRLPMGAVFHRETYNHNLEGLIKEYDNTISEYLNQRTGGKENRNWSTGISKAYSTVYFPKVDPTIREQGFLK